MLTADIPRGAIPAQPSQDDLKLLLDRPLPACPLLAQPRLLVGRAATVSGPPDSYAVREPPPTTCQPGRGERATAAPQPAQPRGHSVLPNPPRGGPGSPPQPP